MLIDVQIVICTQGGAPHVYLPIFVLIIQRDAIQPLLLVIESFKIISGKVIYDIYTYIYIQILVCSSNCKECEKDKMNCADCYEEKYLETIGIHSSCVSTCTYSTHYTLEAESKSYSNNYRIH